MRTWRSLTEKLQQHLDVLLRGVASVAPAPHGEQAGDDPHPIAGLEPMPWQLDGAVALASPDLGDDLVGHARGLLTAHHQLDDARTLAHAAPLQLDPCEQVAGKQR